jgi:hypothetical protein
LTHSPCRVAFQVFWNQESIANWPMVDSTPTQRRQLAP